MSELKELVIKTIKLLIDSKELLKAKYLTINLDNEPALKKDASNISFKINSYKKWMRMFSDFDSDDFASIESIKKVVKSKSLLSKIEEIKKTKTLKDIEETDALIISLGKKTQSTFTEAKLNKNSDFFKKSSTTKDIINVSSKYNISDIRNLQRINGFGEKTAIKFLEENIKLENLLCEWDTYFKENNHNLVPDEYLNLTTNTNGAHLPKLRQSYIDSKFRNTKYLKHLHYSQLIGIKYFHDIEKRIPRTEIAKMGKIVTEILKRINENIIVKVCGSYRRGNSDSGDIDILISNPLVKEKSDFSKLKFNILLKLIKLLVGIGFLYDHITVDGNTKYMGVCRINSSYPYRRIDIRFIEYNALPAALLYFTGSANLNKKMRTEAIKLGYKLNEYGLYKLEYDKKEGKDVLGERIDCPTEKDIFKHLKMEYLKPTSRNIK
jgi:DNA polymerase/3'-5' exonuclease PolX